MRSRHDEFNGESRRFKLTSGVSRSGRRLSRLFITQALLSLALFSLALPAWGSRDFYLSTDQVFAPGDPVKVTLETNSSQEIDVRVYRLADPAGYLLGLEDPHRPKAPDSVRRPGGVDLLKEGWHRSAGQIFFGVRAQLNHEGRKVGREGFVSTVKSLEKHAYAESTLSGVPPLKDLPLLVRFPYRARPAERWAVEEIPIPVMAPGAYLVEAVQGKQGAHTVVLVSELALVTRQGPSGIVVYVAEQRDGSPQAGVEVRILDGNKVLEKGSTGGDGQFKANVKVSSPLVVASRGEHFAVFDPRYYPASSNDQRAYLFTDRPVYRPGHTVFYKGILRLRTDEGYDVSSAKEAKVRVLDPEGNALGLQTVPVKEGSFDGSLPIDSSARPGLYRIAAEVGDQIYGGEFKVKAFRRPEFKVLVESEKSAYQAGDTVSASIEGRYYYGATMPGAAVTYEVYRTRFYVPWWVDADFGWYYSDSEASASRRETISSGQGVLDAKGRFTLSFPTTADDPDHTYVVEAYVRDASGRTLTGQKALRVTRGAFRLEVRSEALLVAPGKDTPVTVRALDYSDAPVKGLNITLELSSFVMEQGRRVKHEYKKIQGTTDGEGRASLTVEVDKPGYFSLTAQAMDGKGKRVEAEGALFVSDDEGGMAYIPSSLELVADKKIYEEGETATFLLMAPFAEGNALMSVEGGDLYRTEVIEIKNYAGFFEVPIKKAQTPNFVVGAAAISGGRVFMAERGVVVPPADRFLKVSVSSSAQEFQPGQKGRITVKVLDAEGKPVKAEVALSMVDEKIFGISPEVAVPMEQFFYPKKRNNVRGGSSLEFRFYGYARDLTDSTAMAPRDWEASFGAAKDLSSKVRKNFPDTLLWEPRLKTDAKGEASLEVTFPDSLTEWRITARAITADTQVGSGLHRVQSRKDVVVELAAPWFLRERDQAQVRIIARNYTSSAKSLGLSLSATGLEVVGSEATKEVPANGSAVLDYQVKASAVGTATLIGKATGTPGDSLSIEVPVLPYGVEEVDTVAGDFLPGEGPRTQRVSLELPAETAKGSGRLTVHVSTGLVSAVLSSLDYLVDYPHGCVEQTMSRFVPDLVAQKALQDLGVTNSPLEAKLPGYIAAGLSRLAAFQQPDGGWGWFAENDSDPYLTAHVMYGLATAKELGHTVDSAMFDRGVERLQQVIKEEGLDPNVRAYALFSLALAGDPIKSMLDKMAGNRNLTPYGKALIALALSEAGVEQRAEEIRQELVRNALYDPATDQMHWAVAPEATYVWQRDPIETTATVLRTLLRAQLDDTQIHKAVRFLLNQRDGFHWASTKDTAAVVYALTDYVKRAPKSFVNTEIKATVGLEAPKTLSLTAADLTKYESELLNFTGVVPGPNEVTLDAGSGAGFFYTAVLRYIATGPALAPKPGAFTVARSYHGLKPLPAKSKPQNGEEGDEEGDEEEEETPNYIVSSDKNTFAVGDLVLVKCKLTSIGAEQPFVMLEDALAGGLEPVEADAGVEVNGVRLHQPGIHREIYDERVVFFLPRVKGTIELAYLVRAVRPGRYQALPARATLMYRPELTGHSGSRTLEVTP